VRQNIQGNFYAEGLIQKQVTSPSYVLELMNQASKRRATSAHGMNDTSSRSHLIVTLTLVDVNRKKEIVGAKLNLVDLAGSERVKNTGAAG
jgi:hypothetical protein